MTTTHWPTAPTRRALIALTTLMAACAPAAVSSPPSTPVPARPSTRYDVRVPHAAFTGARATAPVPAPVASATTPLFPTATPDAARSGVWAGTRTGGSRGGALTLHLRERVAGDLAGELVFGVTPRASTFTERAGRAAGPARVTVPIARAWHEAGRLVLDTDAYYDAGCECTVTGTYRGAVRGDTLTGTYVTRGAVTAAGVRGRWQVVRGATARP